MAIDYSLFAIPKSRVKALDKADARKALEAKDKAESAKAKKRAKGRCEVSGICIHPKTAWNTSPMRCHNKDTETHHLIGGIGRRNKGKSILAEYKLRVCKECHAAITGHVLRPTTAEHTAHTVRFWRAK
jgi:hypothetical protein